VSAAIKISFLSRNCQGSQSVDGKPKSASQLKKEAKKREKLEKFNKKMQEKKNGPEVRYC